MTGVNPMRRGAGWNLHPAGMILSVGVARLLTGALLGFRPFDDTFITFRYAKNIGEGFGFVYNAGEQVLGTTTPLWALVLASLSAAGLPMDEASLVVSLIADVVSALFLWLLLTRLGYAHPVAVGAAVLFLCIFDAFSLARSGMECSLFVALVTGTLAAAASNRVRTAGLLCGLACLTRPEGVVLIPILLCWGWTARSRLARRDLVAAVGLCILVAVPWVAFAMGRFGSVVPQSVLAKAAATHSDASLAAFSWTNLGLFLVSGQYGGDIFARTLWQLNFVLALLGLWAAASLLSTSALSRARAAPAGLSRLLYGGPGVGPRLHVLPVVLRTFVSISCRPRDGWRVEARGCDSFSGLGCVRRAGCGAGRRSGPRQDSP